MGDNTLMAINNFKPFALDPNANVTSQADWEALPALLSGFTAGKASSAQVNKAIRQASFIAAALAQYTANKSGLDVLDDGDLNGFISKMGTAFGKDFQALDATLSALAGLATGANKLPYFTGNDTAAQTDLTSVGRDIIGKNTIADILTYLGIKDASTTQVGLVRLTSSRVSGEEDVAATALAVAQNYSDMKGLFGQCGMKSRSLGVVYTNSQSFAIFVSVNAVLSDGSSFLSANVNVDGNLANFRGTQTTNLAGQRATIAFMVPAGATYIVQQFSGTVSDVTWVEVDKK